MAANAAWYRSRQRWPWWREGARNGAGGSETITGAKPELATQAERKNSLALVGADGIAADAFTGGAAACASGSSKDAERREQEQRQWQAQMSEVRQDVASAGRKLQSLMSTLSAVESELAFIPHVSEALQALEAIASGKDGPRLHIAGEQPATRGSSEAVVDRGTQERAGSLDGSAPRFPPPASVPVSGCSGDGPRQVSRHRQSARDGDDEWGIGYLAACPRLLRCHRHQLRRKWSQQRGGRATD